MVATTRLRKRFQDSSETDPTPLYYRLETILRSAIDSGEYPAGKSLPSEQKLGELYGVSRITVRKAVGSLVDEGLLRRTRGRGGGTFVAAGTKPRSLVSSIGQLDRVSTTNQVDDIRVLAFDMRACDAKTAALLGLEPDTTIRFIERVMVAQDGPLSYVRNYLPASIGKQVQRADLDRRFLKHVLVETYGVKIQKVRDEMEAHIADSRIAALLKIRAGSPVLRVTRLFLGKGDRCVYLTEMIICSKYRMAVTLPVEVLARRR